ncbi:sulfotransferase family 2 domain-containing protein [Rhodovibrionaceae bacterium A322]
MKKPLLCVHIEKTAGTTFKPTVSDQFETAYDYGFNHHWTSQVVHDFWAQDRKDMSFFSDRGYEALFGHFLPEKYLRIDPTLPVLTWIRDPIERLLSDYHFKGPQGDLSLTDNISAQIRSGDLPFAEFIAHSTVHNVLSRYLAKVPDENFVFVGESEDYERDLAQFGQLINAEYLVRQPRNRARGEKHQITAEEEALLRRLQEKDFRQHKRMLQIKDRLNKQPPPDHQSPPTRHRESIWQEVEHLHNGRRLKLPRFLRNAWRIRPPDYREKRGKELVTREDFEIWYLFNGINEFSPDSPVFADVVERLTDLGRTKKKSRKSSGRDWLSVLQNYPQVYRSYYLRSDLRQERPVGDPRGVEVFWRWWDLYAEETQGKNRQGLCELPRFNWEEVELSAAGSKVQLPRLLRDIWQKRPDLQDRFPLASPTFRKDFETWYLLMGITESDSTAPFDAGLLDRNYPSQDENSATTFSTPASKETTSGPINWFHRLKQAPEAFLIYLQRPDLRRDTDIGDAAGVEVFIRWWDREGEKHFGKARAGLDLLPEFDRETVALTSDDGSHDVPRLWRDIWQSRPDLQKAFPLTSSTFKKDFARWYLDSGRYESNRAKKAP